MYLEQGALKINPILSSRAIMTQLTRKYKNAAARLLQIDKCNPSNLSDDEILMLLKTPTHRLLLEKSYRKLIGKSIPDDTFFENLYRAGISREFLLKKSFNSSFDLITPAPFLTTLLDPSINANKISQNSSLALCEIYDTFPVFSGVSSEWTISKPINSDIVGLKKALRDLGRIALEPIEDLAFNIRFVAIVENSKKKGVKAGANYSFQVLPGIIFFSRSLMEDTATLIESLYHECLHIKWVNTFHAYNLLKFTILGDIEKFVCPWESSSREWLFMRAAAAYHVYCHLLAFHRLIVYRRGSYCEWSNDRISVIREKLQILREYINQSSLVLTELGVQYFDLIEEISEM